MKIIWSNITVEKFQNLCRIAASMDPENPDSEKAGHLHRLVFDLTKEQVENKSLIALKQMSRAVNDLLLFHIPGQPSKYITVAGHRFKVQYDPTRLQAWQRTKIIQDTSFLMGNLHKIMAAIVEPVEYGLKFWRIGFKNKAVVREKEHFELSNLMLQVPITAVFYSCKHFTTLFLHTLTEMRPALLDDLITTGMPGEAAEELLNTCHESVESFFNCN